MLSFGAESFVFHFLSKNIIINVYRNISLPVVLYGCETWWLTLREERRLSVFEIRVLRRIFGPKREEITEGGENYTMRSFNDLYCSFIIVQVIKSRRMRWAEHVAGIRGEVNTGF